MNDHIELYKKAIEPYLMGTTKTCSYCDHIEPLILIDGKYTYITLAIGQIIAGYTQICSLKHRTAATGLYEYETKEFCKMKKVVRATYREVYGCNGIAFEHGQVGSCLWGEDAEKNLHDLCHHTHIHFVPVNVNIRHRIEEYLPEFYVVRDIWELKKIRENELQAGPYLYFEDEEENGYVYPVRNTAIPRQFLRRCLAEELNLGERADWIKFPGIELFDESRRKLLPVINKYYKEF